MSPRGSECCQLTKAQVGRTGLLTTKPYGAKELRCTEDRQLYLPCWARRSSRWVQPFRTLIHATILGSATPRRSTTRPPQLRLRCAHRDRGSPACRTSNPGIPVMHTTDTCGLDTRAVTQGGKEEYRPLLVTQQPRKYQRNVEIGVPGHPNLDQALVAQGAIRIGWREVRDAMRAQAT